MSTLQPALQSAPGRIDLLRWVGWLAVLSCVCLRALVGIEVLPHWDTDPLQVSSPLAGITPAASVAVDLCIMLGAACVMWAEAASGAAVSYWLLGFLAVGSAGVSWHAFFMHGRSMDDIRIGATWLAAMWGAYAAWHVCRRPEFRRITLATGGGIVMALAAKGAYQFLIEHRATLEAYRRDPDLFLQSQGWTRGSATARNFERRLSQPEATGWFGLANVYASFAAFGMVTFTGWAVVAGRVAFERGGGRKRVWWVATQIAGVGLSAAALGMAGSKGGATVAGIGLALVAGRMLLARQIARAQLWRLTSSVAGLLAVALTVSAVGALLLRGAIGERMGEPSLLFRWFYLEGATRAFLREPMLGVGPAGFRDAYMVLKPPLSPEEVQSPHSIMFDYAATLGITGLAWVAAWVVWVYALGVRIVAPTRDDGDSAARLRRPELWRLASVGLIATLLAALVERAVRTPEGGLVRIAGLAAWALIGAGVVKLFLVAGERALWPTAIGALMLAVHSQIEVTPVWGGSACLFMVLVAAAGAGGAESITASRSTKLLRMAPATAITLIVVLWSVLGLRPMARWESLLMQAADLVRPLPELRDRYRELDKTGGRSADGDSIERIVADLSQESGLPPPRNPREFESALASLLARRAEEAAAILAQASAIAEHHVPTREAQCRTLLAAAAAQQAVGSRESSERLLSEAEAAATEATAWQPPSPAAYSLLGLVLVSRAEMETSSEALRSAIQAWTRGAALDPYGTAFPLRIMRAQVRLGERPAARQTAARVLELDGLSRLDPLRQLSEQERREVESALRGE